MAKFSIYSRDGRTVRHVGEPQYNGSYMGVDYIEFRTVSSPVPVTWEIGDYVDYYRTGLRYKLYSLPMPNKVARRGEYGASFEYSNVQLHAATKELEIAPFRDVVSEDNLVHFSTRQDFSTYENVYGIARRIQACMDELYPGRWEIRVIDTDDETLLPILEEVKEFSVSGASCLDALTQIYDLWKSVGWMHVYNPEENKDIIIIGYSNVRTSSNTSDAFEYGIGKGLTAIRKAAANQDEFATRLYVYGSERNIQTRYYNQFDIKDKDSVDIRNLMLPLDKWGKTNGLPDARKAYIQASDAVIEKYGLIPRTVYFDGNEQEEIYPSITGLTCADVRDAMYSAGEQDSIYLPPSNNERIDKVKSAYGWTDGTKEDIESLSYFTMHINPVGFDIAEQGKLTEEGHATISMKSGACAGRDFVVRSFSLDKNNNPVLRIEKVWDDSVGESFPNSRYPINEEDIFVLLDIPMPDYYVVLAANKLYERGQKMLEDYTRISPFYEPSIDPIVIKEGATILRAGMYMQVYDKDIIDTEDKTDYVLIDSLTIDESSQLPTYRVTLREEKRAYRSYGVLEEMIEDAKLENKQGIASAKQYTERRFRSAQETLVMLQSAFKNFSEGINPITVQTMAMLVGDESLQFRFIAATGNSMQSVDPTLEYNPLTKQMQSLMAVRLMHMTLRVDDVAPMSSRTIGSYLKWTMPVWDDAEVLEDASKSYYLYAKVPKQGTSGEYLLSEDVIEMDDKNLLGYYYLLVGVLNAEYDGNREFVPLYGFTEVLPGQITTDVIRSADGKTYFDLAGNVVNVGQRTGMSGSDSQLRLWAGAAFAGRHEAPFQVMDNGYFIASNAYINGEIYAESGKVGPLYISSDGLSVTEFPSGIPQNAFGTIMLAKDQIAFSAMVKDSQTSASSVRSVIMDLKTNDIDTPALMVNSSKSSYGKNIGIKCPNGKFAGLRPMTKVISSGQSSTNRNELNELDHSVYVNLKTGTCYIRFPRTPLDGQEYYLDCAGAVLNIISQNDSIFSLSSGNTFAANSEYVVAEGLHLLRFKYYAAARQWVVAKLN